MLGVGRDMPCLPNLGKGESVRAIDARDFTLSTLTLRLGHIPCQFLKIKQYTANNESPSLRRQCAIMSLESYESFDFRRFRRVICTCDMSLRMFRSLGYQPELTAFRATLLPIYLSHMDFISFSQPLA